MKFPTDFITAAQLVVHLDSCMIMYTHTQLPVSISLSYNELIMNFFFRKTVPKPGLVV
jgi:hypothetical protein